MAFDKSLLTSSIKTQAKKLGFLFCGVSKAEFLEKEAPRLEKWLNDNLNGQMNYMANHFDKRLDPRQLLDNAKSVISVGLNYYTPQKQSDPESPKISTYAYGKDYHDVIKDKLKLLIEFIKSQVGEVNARAFVDSAPVMDKVWAEKAGLGWIGKNTNLINKKKGSFFFLAELILDLELDYDIIPTKDHCGTCTRCIDACPTKAIIAPYLLDAKKCISYLTIELKEEIPTEFKGKMDNWMFGCDVCQDVCPWNKFSVLHNENAFNPPQELMALKAKDWQEITEDVFKKVFKDSAVKRTKFNGLKRNIEFLK